MSYSATYSPDDNKLRLYASARLDTETYARVKAAGFRWAPKQELFVAPAWTPGREDLLIELCGEIGDEDTTLVDRAEDRSERFEEYSEKRHAEAKNASAAVSAIADNIPLGQPILVGHHSERHARRDQKRIESGMRRAVNLWRTSGYWSQRAAGALRHAKYKERPDVRARRIKTIEAGRRKVEKQMSEADMWLKLWTECGAEPDKPLQRGVALRLANMCWLHLPRKEGDDPRITHEPSAYDLLRDPPSTLFVPRTIDEIVEYAQKVYPAQIAHCERWISHHDNRLAYERAMLAEQIGAAPGTENAMASRFDLQPGGKVLVGRGEWLTIISVNTAQGVPSSVTTTAPAAVTWTPRWKYGFEKIQDYRPPTEEQAAKIKKQNALAPLCNYPGEGFEHITKAEWNAKHKDYKCTRIVRQTETVGLHRVRHAMFPVHRSAHVYLTDQKRVDPPAPIIDTSPEIQLPTPSELRPVRVRSETDAEFEALNASLKAGVQVIVADQLFETPVELVDQILDTADLRPDDRILEPSAGTGNIAGGAVGRGHHVDCVEINPKLASILKLARQYGEIIVADFLTVEPTPTYDKVLMNPPFAKQADIKHVMHALKFLRPGGRLVAIMSSGIEFRENNLAKEFLQIVADRGGVIERLPDGAFKESGTSVATCIVTIDN